MAATTEELNNALTIISENLHALDKEQKKTARGFKELLAKKNVDRTPFYDAVYEALQQDGRVSVEGMANFPAAPPKDDRVTRGKAIKLAQERLGVSIKREGNFYVTQEDLSPHYDFLIKNMPMNKATFELNCKRRGVDSETIMAGLKGRVRGLSNGTMELIQ